ncbi:MAG: DUF1398 domain-containing protein [Flavobacteriales bacterium]|nr:DUF1398 domain-containing protein [Flavobacteriales bacterium]
MFTVEQIKAAHAKVRSGADFPAYVQEIKALGVTSFETYVTDGHTDYFGTDDYRTTAAASYAELSIAAASNTEEFIRGLKEHQQGKTDFLAFIAMCATYGIEKWTVSMDRMTCTYFDSANTEILVEAIPQ